MSEAATSETGSIQAPSVPHPVAERERIAALDVIRGVALLGILVVNAGFFAFPVAHAMVPAPMVDGPTSEHATWFLLATLFNEKFISLFSFLFGAGLTLQMARLDETKARARARGARGRSTTATILRRLAILLCFGAVHAFGLWYGDILIIYAALGVFVIPARRLSGRTMLVVAACLVSLAFCCAGGMGAMQAVVARMQAVANVGREGEDTTPAKEPDGDVEMGTSDDVAPPPSDLERVFEAMSDFGGVTSNRFQLLEDEAYADGPFSLALAVRTLTWLAILPVIVFLYAPHILGLFALGMAAAKLGWLRPEAAAIQRRVAAVAVPVGVALCAGHATCLLLVNFDHGEPLAVLATALGEIGSTVLAIGYAALLARLAYGGRAPNLVGALADAGRMAFTIYLTETVVMTGIMYWWGAGRFGHFTRPQLFLLAVVVWMMLVIAARLWSARFAMGPLEWVWRMGTYLEVPPLRRVASPDRN